MSDRWPDIAPYELRSLLWEIEAEYEGYQDGSENDPYRVAARAALAVLSDGLKHRSNR